MGYQYKGTQFDAHIPLPPMTGRDREWFDPELCGTSAGYRQHRRAREGACQPCKDANAAYKLEYRARVEAREIKKGWTTARCGTLAGYQLHYRHAVPVCEPCRQVNVEYCRERRNKKAAA